MLEERLNVSPARFRLIKAHACECWPALNAKPYTLNPSTHADTAPRAMRAPRSARRAGAAAEARQSAEPQEPPALVRLQLKAEVRSAYAAKNSAAPTPENNECEGLASPAALC